jgi:excinuclease ABC subunit B
LAEIREHVKKGGRVLITVLTKRLAEELTKYLTELDVKVKYLHSDIDTIERTQIIRDLRVGVFDVLVGINLLREGLDMPEVSLVAILDADKEGFLRSQTALTQTCGRAARNVEGRVIMYADKITDSIRKTVEVTQARRIHQKEYNELHGITPKTVSREISLLVEPEEEVTYPEVGADRHLLSHAAEEVQEYLSDAEVGRKIKEYEAEMKKAAKEMRFEDAAHFRDLMRKYQSIELSFG